MKDTHPIAKPLAYSSKQEATLSYSPYLPEYHQDNSLMINGWIDGLILMI